MGFGLVGGGGGSRLCTVGPLGACFAVVLLAVGGVLRGFG